MHPLVLATSPASRWSSREEQRKLFLIPGVIILCYGLWVNGKNRLIFLNQETVLALPTLQLESDVLGLLVTR